MPNRTKLSDEDIQIRMEEIPHWQIDSEGRIVRDVAAKSFVDAVGIVNSIAILAESMDHHPDILLYGWNKLRIMIRTHSADGLTENDFILAKKIDALNF